MRRTRLDRCRCLAAVAAGLAALIAAPSASAGGWTIEPLRAPRRVLPTHALFASVNAVSCPAPGECVAVGSDGPTTTDVNTGEGLQAPLAAIWNGSGWADQPVPSPSDAQRSTADQQSVVGFDGVSCPTATACVAVGSYLPSNGGSQRALAGVWNASAWSATAVPAPPRVSGDANLAAVSCASPTACMAVGAYDTDAATDVPYAELWNGSRWSLQAVSAPSSGSPLTSVSCPSPTSCTAVGDTTEVTAGTSASGAFAEHWDGSQWSLQPTPAPADYATDSGSPSAGLNGVWCTAPTACIAVGSYATSTSPEVAYAELWNGSTWTPSPAGIPGAPQSKLTGVSCTSVTDCTAVGLTGGLTLDTTGGEPLAEVWNGTAWSAQTTPGLPIDDTAFVTGVSCAGADGCVSVGSLEDSDENPFALAETAHGGTWTLDSPSVRSRSGVIAGAGLTAVSCPSARACIAVGTDSGALVERFGGSRWAVQTPPAPTGATSLALGAISCTSPAACTAVGSAGAASGQSTLAERWNGSRWSIQSTTGVGEAEFDSVSCRSARACMAAGWETGTDGYPAAFAARWSGSAWTDLGIPYPFTRRHGRLDRVTAHATQPIVDFGYSTLEGVSCSAPRRCIAVGNYSMTGDSAAPSTSSTISAAWNGAVWSRQRPSQATALSAISCASASDCMAVGRGPWAEHWDGEHWTLQRIRGAGYLGAISCPTASTCVAAGTSRRGSVQIERWDAGVWTAQRAPSPRPATFIAVSGVSCPSVRICVAVGTYVGAGGGRFPLVERSAQALRAARHRSHPHRASPRRPSRA